MDCLESDLNALRKPASSFFLCNQFRATRWPLGSRNAFSDRTDHSVEHQKLRTSQPSFQANKGA
jgi:hypothetical protein